MAEKPKRKRKRVASSEAAQKDALSSEERSCSETCEEELFAFKNKKSSLEALEEETLKQVQEELYEDCRYEDIGEESDRRKWKRKADYKAWNVLDKPFNDRHQQQQKGKTQTEQQDDSDDDDIAADYHCVPSYYVTPSMPSSQALLSNVAKTLYNLRSNKQTPSGANDSIIDCTTPSPSQDTNYHITLRIRCKGRVHRYSTLTVKPFSEVVSRLADDLGVVKERILLSYQTESVPLNATPDSLSLTTVDFLDALVLEKAITENPVLLPEDDEEQITIRVRSSTKTISYRLGKVSISSLCNFILDCRDEPILVLQADPLDKVLAAFSSAIELPQEQVKFEFDGDPVLPDSTAEGLGLEEDEIIDARITTND